MVTRLQALSVFFISKIWAEKNCCLSLRSNTISIISIVRYVWTIVRSQLNRNSNLPCFGTKKNTHNNVTNASIKICTCFVWQSIKKSFVSVFVFVYVCVFNAACRRHYESVLSFCQTSVMFECWLKTHGCLMSVADADAVRCCCDLYIYSCLSLSRQEAPVDYSGGIVIQQVATVAPFIVSLFVSPMSLCHHCLVGMSALFRVCRRQIRLLLLQKKLTS